MMPSIGHKPTRWILVSLLLLVILLAVFSGAQALLPLRVSAWAQAPITDGQTAAILGGEKFLLSSDLGYGVYLPLINH